MVILWESGEIQNIFRNINLYFPNPQSIGISLPNFFSKVDIKWYLPCQGAQDRHWYIFAKNKKMGPHFIFPTHFLMPQGLINPEFSTQKMMSSWNFHKKKWNPKHFNFFGSVPATKGVFKMVKK